MQSAKLLPANKQSAAFMSAYHKYLSALKAIEETISLDNGCKKQAAYCKYSLVLCQNYLSGIAIKTLIDKLTVLKDEYDQLGLDSSDIESDIKFISHPKNAEEYEYNHAIFIYEHIDDELICETFLQIQNDPASKIAKLNEVLASLAKFPQDNDVLELKAEICEKIADIYMDKDDYEQADKSYAHAIETLLAKKSQVNDELHLSRLNAREILSRKITSLENKREFFTFVHAYIQEYHLANNVEAQAFLLAAKTLLPPKKRLFFPDTTPSKVRKLNQGESPFFLLRKDAAFLQTIKTFKDAITQAVVNIDDEQRKKEILSKLFYEIAHHHRFSIICGEPQTQQLNTIIQELYLTAINLDPTNKKARDSYVTFTLATPNNYLDQTIILSATLNRYVENLEKIHRTSLAPHVMEVLKHLVGVDFLTPKQKEPIQRGIISLKPATNNRSNSNPKPV